MGETLRKQPEPDDPMELRGVACEGDHNLMLDCIIEEYARLGWTPEHILSLFESPFYPLLHNLLQARGADAIRLRIAQVTQRCDIFRFRTTERASAAEIVQIDPATPGGKGDE